MCGRGRAHAKLLSISPELYSGKAADPNAKLLIADFTKQLSVRSPTSLPSSAEVRQAHEASSWGGGCRIDRPRACLVGSQRLCARRLLKDKRHSTAVA